MERLKIVANPREPKGKGAARRLRARGQLPAVLYGPKVKSVPIACDMREVIRVLEHGQNVLIDLKIANGKGAKSGNGRVVMVREVQVDPLKGVPIHVDFYEVSMKETMTVEVPVRLVGKPEGAKMGGILEQIRRELEIECLPGDLPAQIEVDVSHLDIGDSIHVRDITLDKVKILTEPQVTIATVVPPVVEKAAEAEAVPVEEVEEKAEVAAEEEEEAARE